MRKRALEAAQAEWAGLAVAQLPSLYPDGRQGTLRSPLEPTVMPSLLRFAGREASGSLRPSSRRLEATVKRWLHEARSAGNPATAVAAEMMAAEVADNEVLVLALVGGAGLHWFTHYSDWRPEHTWSQVAEWEARLTLAAATPGEFVAVLGKVENWLSVPDPRWMYRSALVGCPERDVVTGRWWEYATGARGAPMPILTPGRLRDMDELYWLLNADAVRSPTLRELNQKRSHFFAVADGPAGFVSFADPEQVGHGSGFLDRISGDDVERQRVRLEANGWPDPGAAFARLTELLPRLQRFYERAWNSGFWIVHCGSVDELPQLARQYHFTAG